MEADGKIYCHCGSEATLYPSEHVYGPNHSYGNLWVCGNFPECDSYVGCHNNGDVPLGTLANAKMRRARKFAHLAFDELWKSGLMSRDEAYLWLQRAIQKDADNCHIAMFGINDCIVVVQAVLLTAPVLIRKKRK